MPAPQGRMRRRGCDAMPVSLWLFVQIPCVCSCGSCLQVMATAMMTAAAATTAATGGTKASGRILLLRGFDSRDCRRESTEREEASREKTGGRESRSRVSARELQEVRAVRRRRRRSSSRGFSPWLLQRRLNWMVSGLSQRVNERASERMNERTNE